MKSNRTFLKSIGKILLLFSLCFLLSPQCVRAESPTKVQATASLSDTDWPLAPDINAECAVLMEAGSGTILYDKKMHQRMYPASTTKILTCLLAVENSALNETVSFSYQAVHSVPADGSSIGMDAGESLPMEQCIYGILVGSANEAANAVAEHVAGSIPAFVQKMHEPQRSAQSRSLHQLL